MKKRIQKKRTKRWWTVRCALALRRERDHHDVARRRIAQRRIQLRRIANRQLGIVTLSGVFRNHTSPPSVRVFTVRAGYYAQLVCDEPGIIHADSELTDS